MSAAETYLRALWPASDLDGHLAVWRAATRATDWFDVHDHHAAAANATGRPEDVYLGLGLHPQALDPGHRGEAEDVSAIPGLWADLDVKVGAATSTDAILAMLSALEFPPSMLVASGSGGIHGYWLFREPWLLEDADERRVAAMVLKGWEGHVREVAETRFGFTLDHVADLGRILRIPGTVNTKGGQRRPVELLELLDDRRYNPSDFLDYVLVEEDAPTTASNGNGAHGRRFNRWRPSSRCPICGGHQYLAQGQGRRCYGYLDSTGHFARCTREERAGEIPMNRDGMTFSHLVVNAACRCGVDHRPATERTATHGTGTMPPRDHEAAQAPAPSEPAQDHPEAPPADPQPVETPVRRRLIRGTAIFDVPSLEYLVDGLIHRDTTVEIFGPTGEGKTLIALDIALSVATGRPWAGREVRQGRVLYVIAEGTPGIAPRVAAWMRLHGVEGELDVVWHDGPVNLLDRKAVGELVEVAAEERPVIVVLDTLARSIPGGDENSAQDMGRAVEAIDDLRRASAGGTVMPLHHTGRATEANGRGSSALDAAMDTILRVMAGGDHHYLESRKQRHGGRGPSLRFRRIFVPEAKSVALEYLGVSGSKGQLTHNERRALEALARCLAVKESAPWVDWLIADGLAKSSHGDAVKRLIGLAFVVEGDERTYRLTDAGREALTHV